MDAAGKNMDARLGLWGLRIDDLAAKTQMPGFHAGFDALMYVDELKALHAVAKSKFDAYRAAGDAGQARLKAEAEGACSELEAAIKTQRRRRKP